MKDFHSSNLRGFESLGIRISVVSFGLARQGNTYVLWHPGGTGRERSVWRVGVLCNVSPETPYPPARWMKTKPPTLAFVKRISVYPCVEPRHHGMGGVCVKSVVFASASTPCDGFKLKSRRKSTMFAAAQMSVMFDD